MLGFRMDKSSETSSRKKRETSSDAYIAPTYTNTVSVSLLPSYVNWTAKGWVNPVQNQVKPLLPLDFSLKHIIHGIFRRGNHVVDESISWPAAAPAYQQIADRPPNDFCIRKTRMDYKLKL